MTTRNRNLRPPTRTNQTTVSPEATIETPIYFAPDYVAAADAFDTTQKAGWVADSLDARPVPGVRVIAPMPVSIDAVSSVHSPAYIEAVRTGEPRELAESSGLVWDAGMWTAVCASTGGVVDAALHAFRTHRHAGSVSSGLHHAHREHGSGFCTFNGLAIAVRAVLNAGAKSVLVLDLDAHCGGGTDSLVRNWLPVVQLDVAVDAVDLYTPDLGSRSTLDLIEKAADYLPTLRMRLAAFDDLAFDVVIYNAGMDPHEDCSLGGLAGITTAVIAERERLVFDWATERGIGAAFVLAGGYESADLSRDALVDLHRLTIEAAAGLPTCQAKDSAFHVVVDDNFHFMDEDYRESGPRFDTYEQALAWACTCVEQSLCDVYESGISAPELVARYKMFGKDPWIKPSPEDVEVWSAWDYAEVRAEAVCASNGQVATGEPDGQGWKRQS